MSAFVFIIDPLEAEDFAEGSTEAFALPDGIVFEQEGWQEQTIQGKEAAQFAPAAFVHADELGTNIFMPYWGHFFLCSERCYFFAHFGGAHVLQEGIRPLAHVIQGEQERFGGGVVMGEGTRRKPTQAGKRQVRPGDIAQEH